MARVYLVQHGVAEPEDVDPGRPLAPQGVEESGVLANFLANELAKSSDGTHPDGLRLTVKNHQTGEDEPLGLEIWHSGKLRARQTAEILAGRLGLDPTASVLQKEGLGPKDPSGRFLTDVLDRSNGIVVVCGHLPFLHRLATDMAAPPSPVQGPAGVGPEIPPFSNSCLFRFDSDPDRQCRSLTFAKSVGAMRE